MRTIGIRREDKDRWESRVPLVPADVRRLTRSAAARFVVQPSARRAFADRDFAAAGAEIRDELNSCDIVLAVKEIPLDLFLPNTTYAFFSHTIKGQAHNMAMLRRLMELECQLIDYERIRDDAGGRLIYFSRFAGLAGAVDTLWTLGRRLEWEGLTPNPFGRLRQTYEYGTLEAALAAVRDAGHEIAAHGLPPQLRPFVVGVTGYGNVAKGAQEVLAALGTTPVEAAALDALFAAPAAGDIAYSVVFTEREMVARRSPAAPFDLAEYFGRPELYEGTFERWLPRLTSLINCIYWDTPYPRLVTRGAVRKLFARGTPLLRVIGDVSCDIEGSVEFTVKETSLDEPVYVYEPDDDSIRDGVAGRGPVVLAVANLPCELPLEASTAFSAALTPFVPALAAADFNRPHADLGLPPELARAQILHHGELTPEYRYLRRFM